ncbi:enoyl-CoA hydratase-related protein [Brevibacterium atlanticum]|uniref:enoyl-CoA hydratase-related protein n=1 Tax=Brevibacterium atlanticum TaxID=2697563 RepID=UPI0014209F61|nr:enoyl-CoA hydratase-related protein [Brevibacterium atlanticum]
MPQLVKVSTTDSNVALIEMAHPPVNAWSVAFIDEFIESVTSVALSDLRCVVVTGGPLIFSAGGDFDHFRRMAEHGGTERFAHRVQQLTGAVAELPMPTIAAINGSALGGGYELSLACDLRFAGANARIGLPETHWGVLPGAGGTQRLARLTTPGFAKRLIFSAAPMAASAALPLGGVDFVTESDDCLPAAFELAEQIAHNSPRAVRAAKLAVDAGVDSSVSVGFAQEREGLIGLLGGADFREGIDAFFERRPPVY